MDIESESPQSRSHYKLITIIAVVAVGLIVSVIIFNKRGQHPSQTSVFTQAKLIVNFPLYSPNGYIIDSSSVSSTSQLVNFSYKLNSGSVVVSEQSKPPIMETVKKIKEFSTSIGPAYIADLEGHPTGFILTDKTLVIISKADAAEVDQLQQSMVTFKLVN